jgi:pyrroline-5-carboxylate reductase
MQVGLIGAGNMARALARGWGDPVLCTDSGSGRAQALAAELGGEAVATNRELAERADVVIVAHKPAQLAEVAWEAGTVVELPERLVPVAGGLSGVGPAYWSLVVEAQVDAAVKRGMPAPLATELILDTMAGVAELLGARRGDTLAVRREVVSPGGTTARGLAALERGGVGAAFVSAMDDVVGG